MGVARMLLLLLLLLLLTVKGFRSRTSRVGALTPHHA